MLGCGIEGERERSGLEQRRGNGWVVKDWCIGWRGVVLLPVLYIWDCSRRTVVVWGARRAAPPPPPYWPISWRSPKPGMAQTSREKENSSPTSSCWSTIWRSHGSSAMILYSSVQWGSSSVHPAGLEVLAAHPGTGTGSTDSTDCSGNSGSSDSSDITNSTGSSGSTDSSGNSDNSVSTDSNAISDRSVITVTTDTTFSTDSSVNSGNICSRVSPLQAGKC